ncbi:amidase family protein [Streptomyces sp. NPDC056296]|uniref:amidase family protein n=1 Tax=Streptomyces sp. NPDC056296 TaxID=3345775 RepID=UPI0035DECCE5
MTTSETSDTPDASHTPEAPDVLAPAKLGPVELRNRVIKAATYEGLSHKSLVTRDLVDFHVAYARGGVGMTTVAYCAVAKEGRTDRHQIHWTDEAMPGLRVLTDAVHAEGAAVSAQIGHGGPVANPKGNGAPALSPSRHFHATTISRAQEIGWEVGAAFRESDVLLSPTLAQPTPLLGTLDTADPESIHRHASVYAAFTSVHNVTGMPAMSVPFGRDGEGLPLGAQFAAPLGGEGLLLALATQLEDAAPWRGVVASVS